MVQRGGGLDTCAEKAVRKKREKCNKAMKGTVIADIVHLEAKEVREIRSGKGIVISVLSFFLCRICVCLLRRKSLP